METVLNSLSHGEKVVKNAFLSECLASKMSVLVRVRVCEGGDEVGEGEGRGGA